MATGTITNTVLYNQQAQGGFMERIAQNINGFNAASNGSILLQSIFAEGDFTKESFYELITGMVRRDDTSLAAVDDEPINMDEEISVKMKHRFGPKAMTFDSFRSRGRSLDEFAFLIGQAMADDMTSYMLNRAISATKAALSGQADNFKDVSGLGSGGGMSHINLNQALAKLGDASSRVTAFVMTGSAYHALMGNSLAEMKFNDSGVSIYAGSVPTLGRPVFVTDATSLADGTSTYDVLCLQRSAVVVNQSENVDVVIQDVTGKANLIKRVQGEGAFNLGVKGFKWDTSGGGKNPEDAAITSAANWVKNMNSHKDLAGVLLRVKQ